MSKIQIRITNDKHPNNQHILDVTNSMKVIDIKKKIIDFLKIESKYIDINILLERPTREFGKFNLEPGILPRSFDNSKLSNFALKDDFLSISFVKDKNYQYLPQ